MGRAKPLASRKSSELLSPRQRILLTRLPAACALVLALQDCGLSAVEISRRLSLPKASIPTLLEISRARLVAMEDNGRHDHQQHHQKHAGSQRVVHEKWKWFGCPAGIEALESIRGGFAGQSAGKSARPGGV